MDMTCGNVFEGAKEGARAAVSPEADVSMLAPAMKHGIITVAERRPFDEIANPRRLVGEIPFLYQLVPKNARNRCYTQREAASGERARNP